MTPTNYIYSIRSLPNPQSSLPFPDTHVPRTSFSVYFSSIEGSSLLSFFDLRVVSFLLPNSGMLQQIPANYPHAPAHSLTRSLCPCGLAGLFHTSSTENEIPQHFHCNVVVTKSPPLTLNGNYDDDVPNPIITGATRPSVILDDGEGSCCQCCSCFCCYSDDGDKGEVAIQLENSSSPLTSIIHQHTNTQDGSFVVDCCCCCCGYNIIRLL